MGTSGRLKSLQILKLTTSIDKYHDNDIPQNRIDNIEINACLLNFFIETRQDIETLKRRIPSVLNKVIY